MNNIITSLNEFVETEEYKDKQRIKEVENFLIHALMETYKAKAFAVIYSERRMYLHVEQIPAKLRRIVGFEEKIINFVNEYNEYLKKFTVEEMATMPLEAAFVQLVEPIITKIEYKCTSESQNCEKVFNI